MKLRKFLTEKKEIGNNITYNIFPISREIIKDVILDAKGELSNAFGSKSIKNDKEEISDAEINDFIKNFGIYFMNKNSELYDQLVDIYKEYYQSTDFFNENV